MKRYIIHITLLLFTVALLFSCSRYTDYSQVPFEEETLPAWENPAVCQINKVTPHAHFIPFTSVEQARSEDKWQSPLLQSLNGTWKFHLAQNPSER
ncbi:MAG: hypothetical protein EOM73_13285, partial [Bacteroidia bacterium]|nr:hypothetical protein [Bacteroidia bacterium]